MSLPEEKPDYPARENPALTQMKQDGPHVVAHEAMSLAENISLMNMPDFRSGFAARIMEWDALDY